MFYDFTFHILLSGKLDVMTLLIQILGESSAHKKDKQDTTPVFLAAQQGNNIVCVCVCV